jgi:hypothetical protein
LLSDFHTTFACCGKRITDPVSKFCGPSKISILFTACTVKEQKALLVSMTLSQPFSTTVLELPQYPFENGVHSRFVAILFRRKIRSSRTKYPPLVV